MPKLSDLIFDQRLAGVIASVLTAVLGIVASIVYATTAANEFNPDISPAVIVLFLIVAAVELVSIFLSYKELRAVGICLALAGLVVYAGTQGNYLANILTAIDGSSASPSLIGMFVLSGLILIGSIASFVLLRERDSFAHVTIQERND